MFNRRLPTYKRKTIKIPKNTGYAFKTIKMLIDKATSRYERIQPAQKEIRFSNSIPFIRDPKIEKRIKLNLEKVLPQILPEKYPQIHQFPG